MLIEPLIDKIEWDRFIEGTVGGTFFHTQKWIELLERYLHCEALSLLIRNTNDELIGVCPFLNCEKSWPFRALDSLPESEGFGGPVIEEHYKIEASTALKDYLKTYSSNNGITYSMLNIYDKELCDNLFLKGSVINLNMGNMILNLKEKPSEHIWNNIFDHKQRKYIRRFDQDGFVTLRARGEDDLAKFYSLWSQNMRQKGIVPKSFRFFKDIFSTFYPENVDVILIENEDKCIGAGLCFIYPKRNSIHLAGVGLDKSVSSRYKIYYKLRWDTIEFASKNDLYNVYFGPTNADISSTNYSMKESFGATFYQNYCLTMPFNQRLWSMRNYAFTLGRKIKTVVPSSSSFMDRFSGNF